MSSRFTVKEENKEVLFGRRYIVDFASYLYDKPTKLLNEPSDCLNQLFASWMHMAYRQSIENGFSIDNSIKAAIKNPVMDQLFTHEQLDAARVEAENKKSIFLEQEAIALAKAIA